MTGVATGNAAFGSIFASNAYCNIKVDSQTTQG